MKTLKAKFLMVLGAGLFLLVANTWAIIIDEYTKEWSKTFEVSQDATLEINNKYGNVHVNTWDQNKIVIKVVATVDVTSKEKSEKILKDIKIVFEGSSNLVRAITSIECKVNSNTCKKLRIDYDVKMPEMNNIVIKNKFGDIFINELAGKSDIKLDYGNLTCQNLKNNSNVIDVAFGKASIEQVEKCRMSCKYSDIIVGTAKYFNVDSKFSSIDMENVDKFINESQYDKLVHVAHTKEAIINANFSNHKLDRVDKKLKLEVDYGSCTVKNIPKGFDTVVLNCKFGSTTVYFASDASFRFDGSSSHGGLTFPRSDATLTSEEKGTTTYTVSGVVGKEKSPSSTVDVKECKFGSVKLKFK